MMLSSDGNSCRFAGTIYLVIFVSLKKQIVELGNSDDFNPRKVTPGDEEDDGDREADEESHVDVDEDGEEEGGHPDQSLGKGTSGEANEVLELKEDSDQGDHDDGG